MSTLWIVHRDPRIRAGLARAAAAPEDAVSGGPGDPVFESAAAPDLVVLGLAGDLEAELQFAHRASGRAPEARWILVPERADAQAARELFDAIDAEILSYPPDARTLRARIRSIRRRGRSGPLSPDDVLPLSQRGPRSVVADRFSRWFADLELPELLRALDPQLADIPLLIQGEDGTGRGLVARYVHCFGAAASGPLVHVPCDAAMTPWDVAEAIGAGAGPGPGGRTIWLENAHTLSPRSQRALARWIEFGPPAGRSRGPIARVIASVEDGYGEASSERGLEPALRDALGGVLVRIPPLRERSAFIAPFVGDTTHAWCAAHSVPARRFGEDALAILEEYPWPGNLRELEAVVLQTLASTGSDPIRADDLQYDGAAFAPLDAGDFGVLLEEDDVVEPPAPANRHTPVPEDAPAPIELTADSPEPEPAAPVSDDPTLQHLVAAIAHELRNPVSAIQTFAKLLPDRYGDAEFRTRFAELVSDNVGRVDGVVQRLADLAALEAPRPAPVDVTALLTELLEQRRDRIHARQLLVLRELDTREPLAFGDPAQLRVAFESLLAGCVQLAPERGDMYIASKHYSDGLRGRPSVRVLVRFSGADEPGPHLDVAGVSPAENSLDFAIAEAVVRAQGGTFTLDASESAETVVVVDVPA